MATVPADSAAVRDTLVRALQLDLVGPSSDDEHADEVLDQAPSRWYLTGFLVPVGAPEVQRVDETVTEEVEAAPQIEGIDDGVAPEAPQAPRAYFPSSLGLSCLVPADVGQLGVTVSWGDYVLEDAPEVDTVDDGKERSANPVPAMTETDELTTSDEEVPAIQPGGWRLWRRSPRQETVGLTIPSGGSAKEEVDVPASGGLKVVITAQPVGTAATNVEGGVPVGTKSVSMFLVNRRPPAIDETPDLAFAFQASIEVRSPAPLIPRPDLRGLSSNDPDERIADLQYRDAGDFTVGHGVATEDVIVAAECRAARTVWIPTATVEHVAPAPIPDVELGMEALAELADAASVSQAIGLLPGRYREWIGAQRDVLSSLTTRRRDTTEELFRRALVAADRIEGGIEVLRQDPVVLEAWRVANRAMAAAGRRRQARLQGVAPAAVDPPSWRPFQLAFVLMNLNGVVEPAHPDREVVDLLFFPTGGGKTEAYLGLAALTLVLRRLRNPGLTSAGVSVLMRYTLRLLTLDQLGRAAALICALELERELEPARLGEWPFEIGLWVGQAATPNRMGRKGDKDNDSARSRTNRFKNNDNNPAPIPLEECPWCGTKFTRNSFELVPDPDRPIDLRIRCANPTCAFTRSRTLPIVAVDEPLYRRLPCFVIATVDKFAAMPWTGEVGAFFGRVDRYDASGFHGPTRPGIGTALPAQLLPPDLVVQDELHLIAGPMGTMVGLYETALDRLASRMVDGKLVGPKIVASTATVRRAQRQIQALFARRFVDVFPPPGADRRDSFFARSIPIETTPPRLYVGIAAQGRSPKVILLRTYLALLGAAQRAYKTAGAGRTRPNPADPYMTLLGYFNSLRELGGTRRIVEDEVKTRLSSYSRRHRQRGDAGLFTDRNISYDVVELTSRVSTDKVSEAKRRLALEYGDKGWVDVALATNMISVGVDITRLGLMVVFGQPKASSEYIQATSRVGRDPAKPGLVATIFNVHRPRDRSHYERFAAFHRSFYRTVEAVGVTPFSPRALDRGLAGTLVALARLGDGPMTPALGAGAIEQRRPELSYVVEALVERARRHVSDGADGDALAQRVQARAEDLMDEWTQIMLDYHADGANLQYQREVGMARPLLHRFLDPELRDLPARHRKFRANRSMRDVEEEVNLWVKTLDNQDVEAETAE